MIPSENIEDSKKISAETTKIDLTTQVMLAQESKELKKEELKMDTFLAAWAKEGSTAERPLINLKGSWLSKI